MVTGFARPGQSVPPLRINEIVHGKRGISTATARGFARAFNTSEQFWLNLQIHYELEVARDKHREIENIEPLIAS